MALPSPIKHQPLLDMCIDTSKDLSGGKTSRKASFIWRLLLSMLVVACGLYMCFVKINERNFDRSFIFNNFQQVSTRHPFCSTLPNSSSTGLTQHFPRPRTYQRGDCTCTPVHYFVILSMQRSGSGWFETLLNNHPNINSHGEVFSVKTRRQNFTVISDTLDTVYNLDWSSSSNKNECTVAVGLKWMLNQGAMEYRKEVAEYFRRRGVSVVLLIRRNALRRLISILGNTFDREKPITGTHVSHVHSKAEAEKLAAFKPTLDLKHLAAHLKTIHDINNDALQTFNITRLLVVYYEDLIKKPQRLMKIQEFLGVHPRKLESRQVKIHVGPLSGLIANWREVYQELNATEFRSLLRQDDYYE
ncbi:hypothetical protein O6H91_03G070900 [Diphasiastrum complanatum]|nr:hypothetical protein O6H91_03G070900 [Diphasiastrum complanatum]